MNWMIDNYLWCYCHLIKEIATPCSQTLNLRSILSSRAHRTNFVWARYIWTSRSFLAVGLRLWHEPLQSISDLHSVPESSFEDAELSQQLLQDHQAVFIARSYPALFYSVENNGIAFANFRVFIPILRLLVSRVSTGSDLSGSQKLLGWI